MLVNVGAAAHQILSAEFGLLFLHYCWDWIWAAKMNKERNSNACSRISFSPINYHIMENWLKLQIKQNEFKTPLEVFLPLNFRREKHFEIQYKMSEVRNPILHASSIITGHIIDNSHCLPSPAGCHGPLCNLINSPLLSVVKHWVPQQHRQCNHVV